MKELLHTLGIDGKLLLAQAVNFLVVLAVLRLTVYTPLLKMLRERRRKIEQGLKDAEDAGKRLTEVEGEAQQRIAVADREALAVVSRAEAEAKKREEALLAAARQREAELLAQAERAASAKQAEAMARVEREAAGLVRAAVAKTVELSPAAIDQALIEQALQAVKKM